MQTTTDNHLPASTPRTLFIAILIFHALGCYFMGLTTLFFDPVLAFQTAFQLEYNPETLGMLQVVIGMELLFLGSIALLGIYWTRKGNRAGIIAGGAVGMYMFLFGFVALFLQGDPQGLYVDSIRGFITMFLGYLALRKE
ncbi:MAG: hypothetical protein AB8E82_09690 [Aureispira sp.]